LYIVGIAVIGGAALGALAMRLDKTEALAASRQALTEGVARGPVVQVVTVGQGPKERLIQWLGDTRAYQTATLYAKVSGYITSIPVDRGERVKAGDLLATVASVETDQQYESAVRDLENKRRNWDRAKDLVGHGWTSRQAADQAETDYSMASATVAQLATMKSYEQIRAPFDGVVTARRTDVGDLITANNESGPELFTVADTTRMRLYVPVPEVNADSIKPGMNVALSIPELPGRTFQATLIGSSNAINQNSGSLLAQFVIDNSDGALKPGDYADVRLNLPVDPHLVSVPASALIFRDQGPQVAVLGPDGRAHLHDVHIAVDLGTSLQIDQGLTPVDRVIENPPDSLMDGDKVSVENDTDQNLSAQDTEKNGASAR
jgi:RND family efflux transporter MFP subunit